MNKIIFETCNKTISSRDELMSKRNILDKKNKSIEELLNGEKKKSELYLGQYKYLKADFENYKKMAERDREIIVKNANLRLIEKMLPLIDDIENAISKTKNINQKKGLQIILDNFMKLLGDNGLEPINCIGKKFDPYYHEVLMIEESDIDDEIVTGEIQKGYMLNKKVIRHSKVRVSKKR
ncbi:MAG: nucleotide exchange factor GrpE [Candidatus Aenigmarchaeota archaeon]|nr:nucleotide exchange factor GrpE [Candidatus Aenigmarchaeota archaeon]